MYDYHLYQEEDSALVDNAEVLLDGNFAVISQDWVVELLTIDEQTPVLCICQLSNGEVYEPASLASFDYASASKRYFTGDIESNAILDLYCSLIRHQNVSEFLALFN